LNEKSARKYLNDITNVPKFFSFLEKNKLYDEADRIDENMIGTYVEMYNKKYESRKFNRSLGINNVGLDKVGTLICEPLSLDDKVLEKFNKDVEEYKKENQEYESKEYEEEKKREEREDLTMFLKST